MIIIMFRDTKQTGCSCSSTSSWLVLGRGLEGSRVTAQRRCMAATSVNGLHSAAVFAAQWLCQSRSSGRAPQSPVDNHRQNINRSRAIIKAPGRGGKTGELLQQFIGLKALSLKAEGAIGQLKAVHESPNGVHNKYLHTNTHTRLVLALWDSLDRLDRESQLSKLIKINFCILYLYNFALISRESHVNPRPEKILPYTSQLATSCNTFQAPFAIAR